MKKVLVLILAGLVAPVVAGVACKPKRDKCHKKDRCRRKDSCVW